MVIDRFSKIGAYHEELHKENQDYLLSVEGKDYFAIMLADGATACENGLRGAQITCEAVAQIIEREGKTFFRYPKEKLLYLLSEQILYELEKNKDQECDIKEYGSTFLLAFMEKKTGRTVLINLGDGAAILSNQNGYSLLLRPKRFWGNPCLTTTKGTSKAMEIKVVSIALGERVLLGTDGFLEQLSKYNISQRLTQGDIDSLKQELRSEYNADDCSYILFTRERK